MINISETPGVSSLRSKEETKEMRGNVTNTDSLWTSYRGCNGKKRIFKMV